MNKADEALVEVRKWLCDSLSDGDAGKVCGMLSVVSRRIVEIEDENAKLRELARKLAWCAAVTDCGACEGACEDGDEWPAGSVICTAVDHMMHELGVEEVSV